MPTYKDVVIADIDEERGGAAYRYRLELPSPDGITETVFRTASIEVAHSVIDQRLADRAHAPVVVAARPEPVAARPVGTESGRKTRR